MKSEQFTGSLAQTEKYNIKYNSNTPVKKAWYRYDETSDRLSFIDTNDWIITFEHNPNKIMFVTDEGYKAYAESQSVDKS